MKISEIDLGPYASTGLFKSPGMKKIYLGIDAFKRNTLLIFLRNSELNLL